MATREEFERLSEARDEALSRMDDDPLTRSLVAEYELAESKLREFMSRHPDNLD